ncbi:MAG: antitoxin VapB family protein [Candidatus Pacearchaeota archaeon]
MTKVISISDEAYEELRKLKNRRSFSKTILDIVSKRSKEDIMDYAGTLSDKEGKEIKDKIYKERKMKSRRFK